MKINFFEICRVLLQANPTTGNSTGVQLLTSQLLATAPPLSVRSSLTW